MGASTPLDAGGSPAGPQIDKHQPSAYISAPRVRRTHLAQVAELVDALVSGTSGAIRGGSSPLLGTTALTGFDIPVSERQYDLVLYGASGFTGRQTVEYCQQFAPAGLSWAIAGRNRAKLDSVNLAGADVLTPEPQDDKPLDSLARQTLVIASNASPFGLYGTKNVDDCGSNR